MLAFWSYRMNCESSDATAELLTIPDPTTDLSADEQEANDRRTVQRTNLTD